MDFSKVTMLNSSCLAILLRLRRQLLDRGHRLVLCSISRLTQGILSVTGLDGVFEITGDTRDACAASHSQAPSAAVPQT
jgi:anti-anti-sigma factor